MTKETEIADEEHLDMLIGFHRDDPRGLANEMAEGLRRGDFATLRQRCRARLLLWRARREVAVLYPPTPDERQARAAEHAAIAAYLAVAIATLALIVSYLAYVKT